MEQSHSPLPKEAKKLMDFPEAITKVMLGEKVTREEWGEEYHGFLNGEYLSLHKPDGNNYQWIISSGDLEAKDYIIIK